jgi:hypothetical protein
MGGKQLIKEYIKRGLVPERGRLPSTALPSETALEFDDYL